MLITMLDWLINALNHIDFSLFYLINIQLNNYYLTLIFPLISEIGVKEYWILGCGLIYFIGGEKAKKAAILCFLAVMLSFFANEVLKIIFERPRPYVVHYGVNLLGGIGSTVFSLTNYSFPSGHSAVIFAVCTIFGKKYGHISLFMALACLVGFSRIYLGVHYPLDVIFGALFGISVSLLILRYENEIFNGFEELINKIKSFNSKT